MSNLQSAAIDQLAADLMPALSQWGWGSAEARTAALAVIEQDAEALAAMRAEDPQITTARQVAHCRTALCKALGAATAGQPPVFLFV